MHDDGSNCLDAGCTCCIMANMNAKHAELERWRRLWTALLQRQRLECAEQNRPYPTRSDVADQLGRDPAELSRLINQALCPKDQSLLVRAAKLFGASAEETRALLVLHQVICACSEGLHDVAESYREMFRPVYGERGFLNSINPGSNVLYQVLLEAGVESGRALELTEQVAPSLAQPECADQLAQLVGLAFREGSLALFDAVRGASLENLRTSFRKHSHILTIDFGVPWGHRPRRRTESEPLRRSGAPFRLRKQAAALRSAGYWDCIPSIRISRLEVFADKFVEDQRHAGVEFVAVMKGGGVFEMEGVGSLQLDADGRSLIAYQPAATHRFTASSNGATMVVIEYEGPSVQGRDPIDHLIAHATHQARLRPRVVTTPAKTKRGATA